MKQNEPKEEPGTSPDSAITKSSDIEKSEGEKVGKGDRIKVTAARNNYSFKGKVFGKQGKIYTANALGWDKDTLTTAHADANLVIERFDEDGNLVVYGREPAEE